MAPDRPPRGAPPKPGRPDADDNGPQGAYPADKARQGDIVLRKKWQRIVFIAGLVGMALLALAFQTGG